MAAPFPIHSNNTELTQLAARIYRDYCWLARWSDEIGTDTEVDMKKLAQLAFRHCVSFAVDTDNPPPGIVQAIETRFAAEGLSWATRSDMTTDLTAIRAECLALTAWVDVNVPEALILAERTYVKAGTAWNEVEVTKKLSKPHAVTVEVAKLRDLFA